MTEVPGGAPQEPPKLVRLRRFFSLNLEDLRQERFEDRLDSLQRFIDKQKSRAPDVDWKERAEHCLKAARDAYRAGKSMKAWNACAEAYSCLIESFDQHDLEQRAGTLQHENDDKLGG